MKTYIAIAAVVLACSAGAAVAGGGNTCIGRDACTTSTTTNKGGNANQQQVQGQQQGQVQGQGQHQSTSTSVNIDNPWATLGVVIGSSNNSPCGRTLFGIPMSGHNCTVRAEAQALYNAAAPVYGTKKAGLLSLRHMCQHDRSMRSTLVAAGLCRVAK